MFLFLFVTELNLFVVIQIMNDSRKADYKLGGLLNCRKFDWQLGTRVYILHNILAYIYIVIKDKSSIIVGTAIIVSVEAQ